MYVPKNTSERKGGFIMMTTGITIYRCAKCGSGNVELYFNGKKMKFPVIESLKQQTPDTFHCQDCGAVLDHCMSSENRRAIDSRLVLGYEDGKPVACLKKYPNSGLDPARSVLLEGDPAFRLTPSANTL